MLQLLKRWFLDPDDLSILVLQAQQQPRLCVATDVLPVLGDIERLLTVDQVYGWLRIQLTQEQG